VKLITMVTGEIDFQDTFSFSFAAYEVTSRNLYDRTMAYFVWIIFLMVIPIILSNMLVSNWILKKRFLVCPFTHFKLVVAVQIALAVGDANEIHENASIRKLELLVRIINYRNSIIVI